MCCTVHSHQNVLFLRLSKITRQLNPASCGYTDDDKGPRQKAKLSDEAERTHPGGADVSLGTSHRLEHENTAFVL